MSVKSNKIFRNVGTYSVLTAATALMAVGIHFFKYPNHFVLGGVTGISVLVGDLVPWLTPATFVSIANLVLIIVGLIFLGKSFSGKTIYCSLLLSGFLELLEFTAPLTTPLTDNMLLELLFAVLTTSICSAVIFNLGGSTGGSDVIGMIIRKYFKIEIGKAVMIADLAVVAAAFAVFGTETGLFSLLGILLGTLIIDASIENINLKKYFIVVTEKPDEIGDYITHRLERGATRWEAKGVYTHEEKSVLLVVVNRFQATRLREKVKAVDPKAFVIISSSSDIIGNGFRANM